MLANMLFCFAMAKSNDDKTATIGDVREIVSTAVIEATDAVLKGMDDLVGQSRREMGEFRKEVNSRFDKLELGQSHHSDEIKGLKADLSDTSTRKKFQELERRVDKYHPPSH